MFSHLLTSFNGQAVVDFSEADDWEGPKKAYRVRQEYEEETTIVDRLETLTSQAGSEKLTSLIIGAWSEAHDEGPSQEIVAWLAEEAARLPALEAIFFGEMTYDECELSWIVQDDLTPLLKAFPKLKTLCVRGGSGLVFKKTKHAALKELRIETGGMGRDLLRQIFLCDFPSLERLELLLGTDGYGFDGGVEDLQPLLSGKLFPKLKHLGLMNSDVVDEIAAVVVNAPVVDRLETLDLSMGTLSDEGVRALHGLAGKANLKRLDVSHYYASQKEVDALTAALGIEVVAEDRQEADEEWRPILHAE